MTRRREGRVYGPPCPVDPEHGGLLPLPSGRYACIHQAHYGRPPSHPAGEAPPTRHIFDEKEV